jgi:mannonate dehydratase
VSESEKIQIYETLITDSNSDRMIGYPYLHEGDEVSMPPFSDVLFDAKVPYALAPWDRSNTGLRVTRVETFMTAPGGAPLVIVKVETNEPGLIGWGCASTPQRPLAVVNVINNYLGPLLVGRRALDIEDFHHLMELSPYWRGGAVENNALAGLDIALWDIKGKIANLPVHQLLGGQTRTRVSVYGHADGRDHVEVIDNVQKFMDKGYEYVRAQIAVPNADTYGAHGASDPLLAAATRARSIPWRPGEYVRTVAPMFEALREAVGWKVELLHDVHERVNVVQAIQLAKDLEPYRLFFLEDAIAPEDLNWYRNMRQSTTTPQAVGETFSEILTFVPLIVDRLIDFARIRLCAVGGITPTVKLAHLCELMGVRLAIHGPGDVSPIGHAAGLAIDSSSRAFGIQESIEYSDAIREVFPGAPILDNGSYEVSQSSGIGVEFDETKAAKYPISESVRYDSWSLLRREDGAVSRP